MGLRLEDKQTIVNEVNEAADSALSDPRRLSRIDRGRNDGATFESSHFGYLPEGGP